MQALLKKIMSMPDPLCMIIFEQ